MGDMNARPIRILAPSALVLTALVSAPTASAHDTLTGTSPGANSTIDKAPQSLLLTFNEGVLQVGGQIAVKGPDGKTVTKAPTVTGTRVSVPFEPSGNGTYAVTWRVTSSDGHPVSGQYSFTLKASANSATSTATSSATQSAAPSTSSTVKGPSTPTTDEPGDNMPKLLIGGGVVAALALAGAFVVARKRVKDDPR